MSRRSKYTQFYDYEDYHDPEIPAKNNCPLGIVAEEKHKEENWIL